MRHETTIHCDTEKEWKNHIVDLYDEGRRFIARRYELIIRVLEGQRNDPQ